MHDRSSITRPGIAWTSEGRIEIRLGGVRLDDDLDGLLELADHLESALGEIRSRPELRRMLEGPRRAES